MEIAQSCGVLLVTVANFNFVLSGRTYFDGVWTTKDQCRPLIQRKGGVVKADVSRQVDVLIFGDLEGSPVLDRRNGMGSKVLFVFAERRAIGARHIHVINGEGLNALLNGGTASCLDLVRQDGSSPIEVLLRR